MSHIFDPKMFKKLDSAKRRAAMPTDLVCEQLKLNSEMVVADVGCGVGYFSFPFSKSVQTVHAIDISDIMIAELNNRIKNEVNILPKLGDFNGLIDNKTLDLFFTANVIHELDDLDTFTTQAISKLKQGGQLAYLDFKKVEADFGPSYEKRIAHEFVQELFENNDLKNIEVYPVKDNFYLVIGTK